MNTHNASVAIIKYLDEATLMQVVTMGDGDPWAATVWYAADNRHNMYWLSPASTRHSQDIQRNDRVCGTITVPHSYGQSLKGVQFEGIARQVPPEELEARFQSFAERFDAHHRLQGLLDGTDENKLYQVIPTMFILYDEQDFPVQPRQEWVPDVDETVDAADGTEATVAQVAAPATTAPTSVSVPLPTPDAPAAADEPAASDRQEPYNPFKG